MDRNLIWHARLSVAPMMDWTDRHCRVLHRLLSRETLLYTEMVTAPALVRGGGLHLLKFSPREHPLACCHSYHAGVLLRGSQLHTYMQLGVD